MNKIKKFASLVLALVMALALAVPAFAADTTYTITIDSTTPGHTYEAYQIFAGVLSEENGTKVLSNIEWGSGISTEGQTALLNWFKGQKDADGESVWTATDKEPTAADLAKWLGDTATVKDAEIAKEFAAKAGEYLTTATGTFKENTTGEGETQTTTNYTIGNLDAGYYLVQDKANSVPKDDAYTRYILEVVSNVSVEPKTGTTTVDKEIVEDGEDKKENEVSIGDTVNYKITGTLPENYADYETYYYEFKDTLSKGLTYCGDAKVTVTVNGSPVTDEFTVTHTENEDGSTSISIKCENLKAISSLTKDSEIVVNYTAVLNENANIGTTEGNPNSVKLIYSNDPNHSGEGDPGKPNPDNPKGETPEDKVITYTTELSITKVDQDGKVLTGAEFTLSGEGVNIILVNKVVFEEAEDGTYYKLKDGTYTTSTPTSETEDKYESTEIKYAKKTQFVEKSDATSTEVKGEVGENGIVTFTGLGAGDYTLTETKTPAGYNTIDAIKFTISFADTAFDVKVTEGEADITVVNGSTTLATTIVNASGATLPSTGGIGTTIFYVVGGVLAAGAVILLITKRRMNIDKE